MTTFEKGGAQNTEETCRIALEHAAALETDIVCATTSGDSAITLCRLAKESGFPGRIVVVSHAYGSKEPGENELSDEKRKSLEESGAVVLSTTHVLSGAERGFSEVFRGVMPVEIVAHTLRMFSAGVKVAVEIAVMALDAGLVPYGKRIVCLGGSHSGLDTAVVLTPSHANRILKTRIHEILCKPD